MIFINKSQIFDFILFIFYFDYLEFKIMLIFYIIFSSIYIISKCYKLFIIFYIFIILNYLLDNVF